MSKKTISVIGAGSWGTALSIHLARNGHKVNLWVYEKLLCEQIKETKENSIFLPGFNLSDLIYPTNSLEEAIGENNVILIVVPTSFIRTTAETMAPLLNPDSVIINAGKGIETNSLCTIREIFKQTLPPTCHFATLSGPTFATEVARGEPSAIIAASEEINVSNQVKTFFSSTSLDRKSVV